MAHYPSGGGKGSSGSCRTARPSSSKPSCATPSRASSLFVRLVDDAPARLRPAAAPHLVELVREAIVDGQFLAFADAALAHVEDVTLEDYGAETGVAAVVDDLSPGAADSAVERPIAVEGEQVGEGTVAAAAGLAAGDLLAGVLDHLAARGDVLQCIDAEPMDLRLANLHLEAGVTGVDDSCLYEAARHIVWEILARQPGCSAISNFTGAIRCTCRAVDRSSRRSAAGCRASRRAPRSSSTRGPWCR